MTQFTASINSLNTQTQAPLLLVLDCSGSMRGYSESQVREGVVALLKHLKNDPIAKYAVTMGIICFNSSYEMTLPFTPVMDLTEKIVLSSIWSASEYTHMSSPLEAAVNALDFLTNEHKRLGVSQYQPQLVIMADGEPDSDNYYKTMNYANTMRDLERQNKFNVLSFAVAGADEEVMSAFSNKGCMSINSNDLESIFKFVSTSMSSVSRGGSVSVGSFSHSTSISTTSNISAWDDI